MRRPVMAPFSKPNVQKQIARDLDAARAGRQKMAQRLADAQAAAGKYRTTAQQLARDGADDATLERAEVALRAGQNRIATLTAALGETDASIAVLEQKLADIADQK